MKRFGVSVIFGTFGVDASGGSTVHAQCFSHLKIRADECDIII